MNIDKETLLKYYKEMTDENFSLINTEDLSDIAKSAYSEEKTRRSTAEYKKIMADEEERALAQISERGAREVPSGKPRANYSMNLLKYLFSFKGRFNRADYFMINCVFFTNSIFLRFLYIYYEEKLRFQTLGPYEGLSLTQALREIKTVRINDEYYLIFSILQIVVIIWLMVTVWVFLSNNIKRLHDLDKSGVWLIVGLVPIIMVEYLGYPIFIAVVYPIYMTLKKGSPGSNKYGYEKR